MIYPNTSRVNVLTNKGHEQINKIWLKDSKETSVKTKGSLSKGITKENLKGKIKLSLSIIYFFALVYFTSQLFI